MNTPIYFIRKQKTFFAGLFFLCTLFCNQKTLAQTDTIALQPLARLFENKIEHGSNGGLKHLMVITAPHAQTVSGLIQLYFEDIAWNTQVGFDDSILGANYVNVAVCTFEYIESIINMSNVSDTAPIRIYFESSDYVSIDDTCPQVLQAPTKALPGAGFYTILPLLILLTRMFYFQEDFCTII
ncbi:MAG: hypothetical protein HY738_22235 [Bacteroidia bacterium]|nr:hypothetical protein [Bacteroidia bacterium]